MHCQACEKVVTKRLATLPGVQEVTVDVANGTASVRSEQDLTPDSITGALQDTHYTVTNVQSS